MGKTKRERQAIATEIKLKCCSEKLESDVATKILFTMLDNYVLIP